jgi:MoxR-like ATPase
MSAHAQLKSLREQLNQSIIGQDTLVLRLLIALLADGHLLVEGAPGLAKTRAIKALGERIEGDFHRIQFTPDLLPSDLTGTEVFRPQDGSFQFKAGPIFHNLVLADEINRAPAKVQSALLEAMAERQVTIGHDTYPLPRLFLVMATQNPIEQEGTYPLPEAQLDRFLMKLKIGYPSKDAERRILDLVHLETARDLEGQAGTDHPIPQEAIFTARREMLELHMSDGLKDYIVELVQATRDPAPYKAELERWVQFGASPRATIAIDLCARAHAWLHQRDHVNPEDIKAIAADVLRHRVLLSFEAEAAGITTDEFINTLLARVPLP